MLLVLLSHVWVCVDTSFKAWKVFTTCLIGLSWAMHSFHIHAIVQLHIYGGAPILFHVIAEFFNSFSCMWLLSCNILRIFETLVIIYQVVANIEVLSSKIILFIVLLFFRGRNCDWSNNISLSQHHYKISFGGLKMITITLMSYLKRLYLI